MRNPSQIASSETVNRSMSKRQVADQTDARTHRSVEAFMANLQHGLQDMTGVTYARELGRSFLTKISSAAERTMNQFLGIQAGAMSTNEQRAVTRLGMGMANSGDRERLNFKTSGGGYGTGSEGDPYARTVVPSISTAWACTRRRPTAR